MFVVRLIDSSVIRFRQFAVQFLLFLGFCPLQRLNLFKVLEFYNKRLYTMNMKKNTKIIFATLLSCSWVQCRSFARFETIRKGPTVIVNKPIGNTKLKPVYRKSIVLGIVNFMKFSLILWFLVWVEFIWASSVR